MGTLGRGKRPPDRRCATSWLSKSSPSAHREKNAPETFRRNERMICEAMPDLFAHGTTASGNVFRRHVKGQHESVGALEFVRLRTYAIGFDLIGHHHKAIIPRRSPVSDILEHRRFVGHALKALQLDLGGFAAIERCMSLVLVKGPGVNVSLSGLE